MFFKRPFKLSYIIWWWIFLGVPHLSEDEVPPAGGKPGWAAPPNPRIGPWLRLLKKIAEKHNLTPEFEVYNFNDELFS